MTYRDERAAYQALAEVAKARGVARRSGWYTVGHPAYNAKAKGDSEMRLEAMTGGFELATGEKARKIKRTRNKAATIGAGVGAAAGGALGALTSPGGVGVRLPATLIGAAGGSLGGSLLGGGIGTEMGWSKARGIQGKGTDLYTNRVERAQAIRNYKDARRGGDESSFDRMKQYGRVMVPNERTSNPYL